MRRIVLFFAVFALVVLGWSCVKEPHIEATLPDSGSVWEELMEVPVLKNGIVILEKRTFNELDSLQRDTLVYRCEKITFLSGNIMHIEIRYGDGRAKSSNDSTSCKPELMPRKDYVVAAFTTTQGKDETIQYLNANCDFRGNDFVSAPDVCASQGSFSTQYDFFYENEEKTLLRMGYSHQGRRNILELIKQ